MHKIRLLNAFTLVELIVVVVIVAILASVGIPKYMKTVDAAQIRDARTQLIALHAANEIYRAQSGGQYLPGTTLNLSQINAGLSINIIAASNVTYAYTRTSTTTYSATATFTSGLAAYTISVNQNPISSSNPSCAAVPGTCPG